MLIRLILIFAGTLCLFLGILGIFVPGLPTTPFLLLTAGLYARSSDRLSRWLVQNQFVGVYITEWRRTRGLTLRSKIKSIVLMWMMISISVIFMTEALWVRILIIVFGLIGTLVMGFIIPTNTNTNKED